MTTADDEYDEQSRQDARQFQAQTLRWARVFLIVGAVVGAVGLYLGWSWPS